MHDDSRIWANDALWKLWCWCVREAKYTDGSDWLTINTGRGDTEVEIKKGQFIFGRHSAARQLRVAESTLWKRIKKLQTLGYLNIESNNKFSVITVIEPDEARMSITKRNSEKVKQIISNDSASDTPKNEKNDKNEENNIPPIPPKQKKNKKSIKDAIEIFNFWNSHKCLMQHRSITFFLGALNERLKLYSKKEIMESIANYAKILESDEYVWSYKFSLLDFLERKKNNIDRFATKNDPFTNFALHKPTTRKTKEQIEQEEFDKAFAELE